MDEKQKPDELDEEFQPRGTFAILVIFIITIIVLWGSVYWTLLSRGGIV